MVICVIDQAPRQVCRVLLGIFMNEDEAQVRKKEK